LDYITIGRFTLPSDLLAAVAAIFLGAMIYWPKERKSIGDWYWNSFFIYIAIYKLSYAIFNFSMFMDTPLSLLYFNGGTGGQVLAFLGLAVYLTISSRVKNSSSSRHEFIPGYFSFFMLYETALFALSFDLPATSVQAAMLAGFLVIYYKGIRLTEQLVILMLMAEALVLSLFSNLLLVENLLIIGLGVFLLISQRINKEELQP
jgi:hypothetical protein